MAVPQGLRNESKVQFLENARVLQKFAIIHSVKLPKRYTGTMGDEIIATARRIYREVLAANEYPATKAAAEKRTEHFDRALFELKWLASQVDLAYELCSEPEMREENERLLKSYAEIVYTEIKLINGIKKSDEKQFASLKSEI